MKPQAENTLWFEIPIHHQCKVILLLKSSIKWVIDASLMKQCQNNFASGLPNKCPELEAGVKYIHSRILGHSS